MRITVILGGVVAVLLAIVSLGGLLAPGMYVRESADWATQAVAQDWFDLAVAAPVIAGATLATSLGSRRAAVVLAGGLVFAAYTLAIYCFSIHFNAMFLVYCGAFGAALFGSATAVRALVAEPPLDADHGPRRLVAGTLIVLGVGFAMLWLGSIVPALLHGEVPAELRDTALPTNPVHVLDLSIVLPLHLIVGYAVWRRHRLGATFAAVLLGFGVLMAASIAALLGLQVVRGHGEALPPAVAMLAIAGVEKLLLIGMLRWARPMQRVLA